MKRGLGILALVSCVHVPEPTALDVERAQKLWPETTLETLQAGREKYFARCTSCHSVRAPHHEHASDWPGRIDEMIQDHHLKLSAGDRSLIERFLVTLADAPEPK